MYLHIPCFEVSVHRLIEIGWHIDSKARHIYQGEVFANFVKK